MCIPCYVATAVMSGRLPWRSLANSVKRCTCPTMSSVCWTTSRGLYAITMAVSLYHVHPLLAHSEHSSAVRMPSSMCRVFSTESRERDGELTPQRNQNKRCIPVSYLVLHSPPLTPMRTEEAEDQYMDKGVPPCQPFQSSSCSNSKLLYVVMATSKKMV